MRSVSYNTWSVCLHYLIVRNNMPNRKYQQLQWDMGNVLKMALSYMPCSGVTVIFAYAAKTAIFCEDAQTCVTNGVVQVHAHLYIYMYTHCTPYVSCALYLYLCKKRTLINTISITSKWKYSLI